MKRISFLSLYILMIYCFSLTGARYPGDLPIRVVDSLPNQHHKKITFFVYIAGDNDLREFALSDLQEMASISSNEQVHICVYLHSTDDTGDKFSKKLLIGPGYAIQDGIEDTKDSGDATTLTEGLLWAATKCPSEMFVTVLWNHGTGAPNREPIPATGSCWWMPHHNRMHCRVNNISNESSLIDRAVCFDDTTGNFLTDKKLRTSFKKVCALRGKKVDVIAFDACLMSDIEVVFTLSPYADYMVASQQTIPGEGYGYGIVLNSIDYESITKTTIAHAIVDAYQREYEQKTIDYTLAAIDVSQALLLAQLLNTVAIELEKQLSGADVGLIRRMIRKSQKGGAIFAEENCVDILTFCRHMIHYLQKYRLHDSLAQVRLINVLHETITRLHATVLCQAVGLKFSTVGGISIYLNERAIDPAYASLYWSKKTAWLRFLQRYIAAQD